MIFGGKKAKDPVCGMSVDPKNAQFKSEYQGNTYYFCSGMCKTSFDKDPVKYVKGGPGPTMHHS